MDDLPVSTGARKDCTLPRDDERIRLFAAWLLSRRSTLGLTQQELADRVGIDRTYVQRLERSRRSPGRDVLGLAVQALELTPSEIDWVYVLCGYAPPSLQRLGWPTFFTHLCASLEQGLGQS